MSNATEEQLEREPELLDGARKVLDDARDLLNDARERLEEANKQVGIERERRRQIESAFTFVKEKIRGQTIVQYMEACHSLYLTNPDGRVYPERIIPWEKFPALQLKTWERLRGVPFCSETIFPSRLEMEAVAEGAQHITNELDLQYFTRQIVHTAVQKMIRKACWDKQVRGFLGLKGVATFKPRMNPGGSKDQTVRTTVYHRSNGENVAKLAIEYKAPHNLTKDEVMAGLVGEIQPKRDVINRNMVGFAKASRALVTAVITQLFSHMVSTGIQYGYVCTGETMIFLCIPDNPRIVYYYKVVPSVDALGEDDEHRLYRTAVAQVFAFVVQALGWTPPPREWHDIAKKLEEWNIEYDNLLDRIPETDRKNPKGSTNFKPPRWRNIARSRMAIADQPFCSQECLLGLVNGDALDVRCPNIGDHPKRHISLSKFRRLVRRQLSEDGDGDADAMPIDLSGATGTVFKVRLSSYGYTVVAKGAKGDYLATLRREGQIYDMLIAIQGDCVPVSLGIVDLALPYYPNGDFSAHFLLLSWAGLPLCTVGPAVGDDWITNATRAAYNQIHENDILHGEPAPWNVLYDTRTGRIMVVDFHRAKIVTENPAFVINPNGKRRRITSESRVDEFAEELSCITSMIELKMKNRRR
ncbi:hypothetical protein F4808DRAFT_471227 [Astrocystis sublimbata]|nr:hypothetical protein F4808DRAFT_471227 [Astrocystis sublimbata]